MKTLLTVFLLASALSTFSACGGPDESSIEPEAETATSVDAVSADGSICHGVCSWGNDHRTRLCYPNITQNCREQIVDACHRRGLSFVDAYWSHWGCG